MTGKHSRWIWFVIGALANELFGDFAFWAQVVIGSVLTFLVILCDAVAEARRVRVLKAIMEPKPLEVKQDDN